MAIPDILTKFKNEVAQCANLITNAHQRNAAGTFILSELDRRQITAAAFLNKFIAWESFLEASLADFMIGAPTIGGAQPTRYVAPPNADMAKKIVVGSQRFFDYANHQYVLKIVRLYFDNGYPFEPHISGIFRDLDDLRAMRNACAHISSTTQLALEGLAIRIFGQPKPGITIYDMLTSIDPRENPAATVFQSYRIKLEATADLIANG
ncbi:MAG: hypothetical protein JSR55_09115 [Proteobacteria bacterium]|nr:hypothetical protein [Pseudomonadota bacterium]